MCIYKRLTNTETNYYFDRDRNYHYNSDFFYVHFKNTGGGGVFMNATIYLQTKVGEGFSPSFLCSRPKNIPQ